MGTFATFYQWLFPPVPFEFIKHRSPDECASLLAARAGKRSFFLYSRRFRIEITPYANQEYEFILKQGFASAILVSESHGHITEMAEDYALVEGVTRTTPGLLVLLPFGFVLYFLYLIVAYVIVPGYDAPAMLGAIILMAVSVLFTLYSFKSTSLFYTDLTLGILLHSFQ